MRLTDRFDGCYDCAKRKKDKCLKDPNHPMKIVGDGPCEAHELMTECCGHCGHPLEDHWMGVDCIRCDCNRLKGMRDEFRGKGGHLWLF